MMNNKINHKMDHQSFKNFMGKTTAYILGGAVCANMIIPAAGVYASQAPETSGDDIDAKSGSEAQKNENLSDKDQPVGKDETVYVKLNPDGSTKNIIVSDWLKNLDQTASLEDASDLSDIKNVKGTESFVQDSDNSLVWSSSGSDIYYQGTTNKPLPVTIKITYYLDGKEISAQDLAGKSGQVKIRYEYENNAMQDVVVGDQTEQVATPFAVVTGMILPQEKFSNITVTNGRVISDGSKAIVAGLALPGLSDSLNLSESELTRDFKFPDYIEVTADVTDFSMDMTASVITSDIFGELGIDDIDSIDELESALNELTSAAAQLVDGSGDLLDGVDALKSGFTTFTDGLATLQAGAGALKDGAGQLQNGIGQYTQGAQTLENGVSEYTSGAVALADGITQYSAGASQIADGINTLASQTAQLPDGVTALNDGVKQVQDGAAALTDETKTGQLISGSHQVTEGVGKIHDSINVMLEALKSTDQQEAINAMIQMLVTTIDAVMSNDQAVLNTLMEVHGIQGTIDSLKSLIPESLLDAVNQAESQYGQKLLDCIKAMKTNLAYEQAMKDQLNQFLESGQSQSLDQLIQGLEQMAEMTDPENSEGLYVGAASVSEGITSIVEGNKVLKSGIDTVAQGSQQLTDAASQLPTGIGALVDGANQLVASNSQLNTGAQAIKEATGTLTGGFAALTGQNGALTEGSAALVQGIDTLFGGTNDLVSGAAQLGNGIDQLADGAQALSDGMKEFDAQGIEKLKTTMEEDAQVMIDRLQAMIDAGQDYQTFTQLPDGVKGSVKFIVETEGIKAAENN